MRFLGPTLLALLLVALVTACGPSDACADSSDCDASHVCLVGLEGARCAAVPSPVFVPAPLDAAPARTGLVLVRASVVAVAPSAHRGAFSLRPLAPLVRP